MIRLVGAELNRLVSRRVTLVLLLGVIVVIGVFQVGVAQAVTPPSVEDVAQARKAYEDDLKLWEQEHEEFEKACIAEGNSPEVCVYPRPTEQDYGLVPTPFASIAGAGVIFSVVLSMLAAYLIGASFVGAEFGSGSLGNWLTFVPQRWKVFASKSIALSLGAAGLAALSGLVMIGVAAIITAIIGQPVAGIGDLAATAGRGVALTVFAALLGFSIAMLTGYTVAALGALLGYGILVLGLNILGFLLPALSLFKRWQVETNVQGFLAHGTKYYVIERTVTDEGVGFQQVERTLSFGAASGYLAAVIVAFVAMALLVFRRRDVS